MFQVLAQDLVLFPTQVILECMSFQNMSSNFLELWRRKKTLSVRRSLFTNTEKINRVYEHE